MTAAVLDTITRVRTLWTNSQGVAPDFVVVPLAAVAGLAEELVLLKALVTAESLTENASAGTLVIDGQRLSFGPCWGAGMDFPIEMLVPAADAPEPSRIYLPH